MPNTNQRMGEGSYPLLDLLFLIDFGAATVISQVMFLSLSNCWS
jgi:hypothetical protein